MTDQPQERDWSEHVRIYHDFNDGDTLFLAEGWVVWAGNAEGGMKVRLRHPLLHPNGVVIPFDAIEGTWSEPIGANDQREWMRRFGSAPAIEGDDAPSTTQEAEKACDYLFNGLSYPGGMVVLDVVAHCRLPLDHDGPHFAGAAPDGTWLV